MVKACCVYNCRNRATAESKANNISFFRFPANKRKLQAWIKAVNRKDWEPTPYTAICSEHFVFGWHSDDPRDVNYAPTLFIDREKRRKWKRKTHQNENDKEDDLFLHRDHGYDALNNTGNLDETNLTENQLSIVLNVATDTPEHLKDHQYCKTLPWPGKRQIKTSTKVQTESSHHKASGKSQITGTQSFSENQTDTSEQLAAESLLLLFQSNAEPGEVESNSHQWIPLKSDSSSISALSHPVMKESVEVESNVNQSIKVKSETDSISMLSLPVKKEPVEEESNMYRYQSVPLKTKADSISVPLHQVKKEPVEEESNMYMYQSVPLKTKADSISVPLHPVKKEPVEEESNMYMYQSVPVKTETDSISVLSHPVKTEPVEEESNMYMYQSISVKTETDSISVLSHPVKTEPVEEESNMYMYQSISVKTETDSISAPLHTVKLEIASVCDDTGNSPIDNTCKPQESFVYTDVTDLSCKYETDL